MDPSILIGTFLACDMGGYQLSMELANSTLMGEFSGMVIASGLGATISFSIPVAFGMIPKKIFLSFKRNGSWNDCHPIWMLCWWNRSRN